MAHCKRGKGIIKVNGVPLELVEPEVLRYKVFEPVLLLGRPRFATVDIRVRVKGGGHVSQVYGAAGAARWPPLRAHPPLPPGAEQPCCDQLPPCCTRCSDAAADGWRLGHFASLLSS